MLSSVQTVEPEKESGVSAKVVVIFLTVGMSLGICGESQCYGWSSLVSHISWSLVIIIFTHFMYADNHHHLQTVLVTALDAVGN